MDLTERIPQEKLYHVSPRTRVFSVKGRKDWYIIDTESGRKVACQPHIVNEELRRHMIENAQQTVYTIYDLFYPEQEFPNMLIEHILRASLGYEIHTAHRDLWHRRKLTEVEVRPKYTQESYRDHAGLMQRKIEIVHEDFNPIRPGMM